MSKRPTASLDAAYFDRIYAQQVDPWGFETSEYEREKYARTVAALPRARYRRCLEIGCSVGVLSALLLERCDELFATEINAKSLARARERNAGRAGANFRLLNFPSDRVPGRFDLVVLSEVAYYWAADDFGEAQRRIIADLLEPSGQLILVHYTPEATDYPMTGDEVHEAYLALAQSTEASLIHLKGHRAERYRLDVFERR